MEDGGVKYAFVRIIRELQHKWYCKAEKAPSRLIGSPTKPHVQAGSVSV